MQRAIDDICRRETFDFVQLESSVIGELFIPQGAKVVVDEHNIEYEIYQRGVAGERSLLAPPFSTASSTYAFAGLSGTAGGEATDVS